jgi:hypothetical protein
MNRTFRPFQSRAKAQARLQDLRSQAELARLDLRALVRSLDRRRLLQELPEELLALMELDADLAQALWVLDRPGKRFDMEAMRRDTLASLAKIPAARMRVLALLDPAERTEFDACWEAVRSSLAPSEAYVDVPGRDPLAG